MVGRYFSEFLAILKKILSSRHKYQSWEVTQFGGLGSNHQFWFQLLRTRTEPSLTFGTQFSEPEQELKPEFNFFKEPD
jgi:hypothetical protein